MDNIKKSNRRAFILITSLLFASILVIIALPYVSRITTEYMLMMKIYSNAAALNLAEAGVERGLWEINHNSSTFNGWSSATDANGNHTYGVSVNGFKTASNQTIGDYDVTAWVSADEMSGIVTGKGYVPNRTSPSSTRIVKVTCARQNFNKAVLSLNGITMSGQASTDSYDSSLGTYDSQTPTLQGDIATNGAISLSGQAYVGGDANPGASYPFTGVPNVEGSYGTLQAPIVIDPIPPSALDAARASNNNSGIIHELGFEPVSGYALSVPASATITLPAGTYYFTSISVNGTVNTSGSVVIYVDGGNIAIAGQGLFNDSQPRDLLIYSTGSSINIAGQADLSGAIYAPNATVTLTGQENVFGSIVCGSNIDSGQAKIHYDLDLMNVTPVFASNRVTSWQELKQ